MPSIDGCCARSQFFFFLFFFHLFLLWEGEGRRSLALLPLLPLAVEPSRGDARLKTQHRRSRLLLWKWPQLQSAANTQNGGGQQTVQYADTLDSSSFPFIGMPPLGPVVYWFVAPLALGPLSAQLPIDCSSWKFIGASFT